MKLGLFIYEGRDDEPPIPNPSTSLAYGRITELNEPPHAQQYDTLKREKFKIIHEHITLKGAIKNGEKQQH